VNALTPLREPQTAPGAFVPTPKGTPFRTLWALDGVSRNRTANARPPLEVELGAQRTGHAPFRLSDWHCELAHLISSAILKARTTSAPWGGSADGGELGRRPEHAVTSF
jgi:hypothetical protein